MHTLPQRQVHLDFHTSEAISGIGSHFDKEQFQRCLKKGHVNSITVFAKCHHGWAYFPSETNTMHPGLSFDLLSAELEACREIGVAAPIYLSAGLDEKYAVEHPEHLRRASRDATVPPVLQTEEGVKYFGGAHAGYHNICMNTPYLDVLRAQVEEVARRFDPCGIFLDIVSPRICFCDYCRASVREMGMDENEDAGFEKLAEITYRRYYETVNRAARVLREDMRVFHNGGHIRCGRRDLARANSHLELESLPTGGWGYDHFPKSARYVAKLGMEYLGMTGKFHESWGEFGGFKHPNALRYEIALSLANGASCSVGDQMHPYGFLDEATYELIGAAYAEAEAVEEYCYDADPIADIGILSVEAAESGTNRNAPADVGACRILLEGKYLYDVLDTECDFTPYKLLILPDTIRPAGELAERLRAYVDGGGKVLCSGESGLDGEGEFLFDLGVGAHRACAYHPAYYRPDYDALGLSPSCYVCYSPFSEVSVTDPDAKVLGYRHDTFFNRSAEHFCSHRHTPFVTEGTAPAVVLGKEGAYIAWRPFTEYAERGSIIQKDTVCRVIDALLGDRKTLRTNLPASGVVTLTEQRERDRHILHLLYATPVKRGSGVEVIEDLIPIANTELEIRLDRTVTGVILAPQSKRIPYVYEKGVLRFKVDSFTCSQIVVIEHT